LGTFKTGFHILLGLIVGSCRSLFILDKFSSTSVRLIRLIGIYLIFSLTVSFVYLG